MNLTTNGTQFDQKHRGPGNFSLAPALPMTAGEHRAWVAASLIIDSLGAIGNLLLILITRPRCKKPNSGFQVLMFHLVLINFVLCFTIPIGTFMVQAKRDGKVIPLVLCRTISVVNTILIWLTVWSDVLLTVNRCLAVFFPHSYRQYITGWTSLGMIIVAWFLCCGCGVPAVFDFGATISSLPTGLCSYTQTGGLGIFYLVMTLYGPYCLNGLGSLLIIQKIYSFIKKRRNAVRLENDEAYRVQKRRLILARMTLIVYLWTVACNFPSFLIFNFLVQTIANNPSIILWFRVIQISQYSVAPYIIIFTNIEYRKQVTNMLRCLDYAADDFLYEMRPTQPSANGSTQQSGNKSSNKQLSAS